MAINIEEDLERMLQAIVINANYECDFTNLNILLESDFYFDVCRIIFPELNIKLIKIKENQGISSGDKLQYLIQILSRELQIDLSSINGQEILKGHLLHIHHFLQVLEKFSQLHQQNASQENSGEDSSRRVKSDQPNTSQRVQKDVPRSAREKIKRHQLGNQQRQEISSKSKKMSSKKKRPYSANHKKKKVNESPNMHGELIQIMLSQNKRALYASMRDNRKKKNTSLVEIKNKYKSYLINHAKQERAAKNRQKINNKPKKQYRQLPIEDYDKIENHFKNFSYKLRQAKYRYLKRLEKTIRDQEMDRMCYNNRLMRQNKDEEEKKIQKQLDRINNEHKIRNELLKQQANSDLEAQKLMKKEYNKYLRNQKKELKENKKQELKRIKDFIDQENNKVLMNLEEGGPLERMIIDMYKRL